jgi:acyl carrier protein
MEIKKFIANFAEAIDANVSDITEELEFKNLTQWDSMALLSLIAMVDEYYSKVLTGEEIENSKTIKDLFKILTK